jgi:hypothetical protein
MAISRDANSAGSATSTSLTVSHTVTGSNPVLFVSVFYDNATVVSMTYNGVAMTLVKVHAFGSNNLALYVLANPATGTHNIVFTVNTSVSLALIGASYTGGAQTNQPGANADSGESTSTPKTTSLTTLATESWMVMVARNNTAGTTSASTGADLVRNAGGMQFYDTNGTVPVGSNDMLITFTGGNTVDTIIAELKATGTSFTVSDTQSSSDTVTTVDGLWFNVADTVTPVEGYTNTKIGFSNQDKSEAGWTNQEKS